MMLVERASLVKEKVVCRHQGRRRSHKQSYSEVDGHSGCSAILDRHFGNRCCCCWLSELSIVVSI